MIISERIFKIMEEKGMTDVIEFPINNVRKK